MNDEVYDKVDDLLKELLRGQAVSDYKRSEILNSVFGVASDPDSSGQLFALNTPPKCPDCGSISMDCREVAEPPEYMDCDFHAVTHQQWQCLTQAEKVGRVENALME